MSDKQENTTLVEETIKHSSESTSSDNIDHDQSPSKQNDARDANEKSARQLGTYLKNLRNKNKVSIKQLSIDTKINESVLANLEAENFKNLPRKIYLSGFIKTYTNYFHASSADALKLLDDVFQQDNPVTDVKGRFENHQGTKVNSSLIIKGTLSLVFLMIITLLVKKLFFSTRLEIINPEITTERIDSSTPLVGSPSNIELSQESSELKTIANTEQSIQIEDDKKSPKLKAAKKIEKKAKESSNEEGDQLPTEVSLKRFPENYLVYRATKLEDIKDFIPENILQPNPEVSQKVIVSANNDKTWLAYQKDNMEIKQLILKEGKVLVISGNEIRMVIGNSNSIRLVHNQKEVNIKSKTGIKSLVFPQESVTKYRLPLFYRNSNGEYVASGKVD